MHPSDPAILSSLQSEATMSMAPPQLTPELADDRRSRSKLWLRYGLDFFPTIFEVDRRPTQLNAIAAVWRVPDALPPLAVRAWSTSSSRKGYDYGLSEDLRDGDQQQPVLRLPDAVATATVDQKLVMAHVYGHCDFFKNNATGSARPTAR